MKNLLVVLLVILTSACTNLNVVSKQVTWTPQGYSDKVARYSDKDAAKFTEVSGESTDKQIIHNVKYVNNLVNDLMTYRTDIKQHGQIDRWDDHVDDVVAGNRFVADCEDAAITKAKILVGKKMVEPEQVRLLLVCSTDCQIRNKDRKLKHGFDHMITVVRVGDYDYSMDITLYRDGINKFGDSFYKVYSSMSMAEEGVWRKAYTEKVE